MKWSPRIKISGGLWGWRCRSWLGSDLKELSGGDGSVLYLAGIWVT